MDVDEQIKIFREFIEQNYYPQLLEAVRKGQTHLVLDFSELIKFNTEVIEELLESPEDLLKAAELAIKDFDLPKKITKFNIRFSNLPESLRVKVSEIRSKHLNKMIWCEGIIRQKSDVRPHIAAAKFECPSCGNVINIIQLDKKYKEPSKCSCGRKGKFKEIARELVDGQGIVLEESADDLEGNQPKRINVFLKDDLVSPISERKTGPGSRVKLCGWVSEVPIILKTGGQSTKFDLIIEANNVEPVQDDFTEMQITEEEEEKIKEIGRDPNVLINLGKSLAPSIYGHDKIKEALVLQLAGGCRKVRPDGGATTRGDIHVLLIGDPGSGKSQLLKRITGVAPKARFTSGKGATAAGLTASVVKDEFLGGWSLEAGTLVLANRGFAVIDEMDKMGKEDRSALHEALEQQTVSISKANIQATLRCETTVLAAANPKFGRFDPYDLVAKQIDLPPTLINRFDLIFPVKDLPNREKDDLTASFILAMHKDSSTTAEIPTLLLRKYFAYIRQRMIPKITDQAIDELKEYYVKMRNSGSGDETNVKSIPITARQLEALVRLSEASAKVRLSKTVTKKDAQKAIELIDYCLNEIARDKDGKIDIDRIGSKITASQRSAISVVKEIISVLEEQMHTKIINVDDIISAAQEKNIPKDQVEDTLEKLRRSGDLFEPKKGFVQKL